MTYRANGILLDDLFEGSGSSSVTDYSENGTPFSNIYQGLEKDQRIPDIGYASGGTDLARLLKGNISQYSTTVKISESRTAAWNGSLIHDTDISFSSAGVASYFFTYGGRIIMSASRTGGSSTSKNAEWSSLLNDAGNIELARQATYKNTETQVSGVGYLDLTGSFQLLYTETGSSPYTSALYRVYARFSATNVIRIRVRFDDGASGVIDENINGTITSFITERKHPSATSPSFTTVSGI